MKNLSFIVFIFFLSFNCFSQDSIYQFNEYYINLKTLEKIQGISENAKTFKEQSKFATRFISPLWFESYPAIAVVNERKIELKNNELFFSGINDHTGKKDTSFKYSSSSEDFLLTFSKVFVRIKKMPNKLIYAVLINDENGQNIKYLKLTHTMRIEDENGVKESPFLGFYAHTTDNIVFTSYNKDYPLTHVIDVNTCEQATQDFAITGIIRSEDEKKVQGFVEQIKDGNYFKITMPEYSWETENLNKHHNEVETLLKDTIIIMATYSKIATGADLKAYHAKTGKLLWKADVAQLKAAHSQYYNKVHLSLFQNKIIMEGIEAGGTYLQIFDIKKGERLYTDGIETNN